MRAADRRATIAMTAAGSGVAQTVTDGLRACPFPVRVIGFELEGRAKGLYDCDAAHRLPQAGDSGYPGRLASLCREEGVQLLIPGPDLPVIAGVAVELERRGCRVLSSSSECIRICHDRKALHDFLAERGAPFFPTWLARGVASQPAIVSHRAREKMTVHRTRASGREPHVALSRRLRHAINDSQ